ncbi:MAG: TetR/AcrR family transcriptional regulator [Bacillota bacterium]
MKSQRGIETQNRILEEAVQIASLQGLESLTIGTLSKSLALSKSGLFAHFGSKLELQKIVIKAAKKIFKEIVIDPVTDLPYGKNRLMRLCDGWLSYVEQNTFRGGCFFANATIEFDGRPGEIRDMLQLTMSGWLKFLRREIVKAQRAGELSEKLEPEQAVFELQSIVMGANWHMQLFGDINAIGRAKKSIERLFNYEQEKGGKTNA